MTGAMEAPQGKGLGHLWELRVAHAGTRRNMGTSILQPQGMKVTINMDESGVDSFPIKNQMRLKPSWHLETLEQKN